MEQEINKHNTNLLFSLILSNHSIKELTNINKFLDDIKEVKMADEKEEKEEKSEEKKEETEEKKEEK